MPLRRRLPARFAPALATGLLLFPSLALAAADPFEFDFRELAPGVWSGVREEPYRLPVMGNTTFVITTQGVVVHDGGGVPLMAERLLAKIAAETDQPVTHVGISHWHGDHHFGIARILEEFPNAEVIAHPFTREAMLGSPIAYVDRHPTFVERQQESLQRAVDTGLEADSTQVSPARRAIYRQLLEDMQIVGQEFQRTTVTVPTITVEERLVLHRGEHTIEFRFLGAGNTAGDLVMWLPNERIVATGDLVVHPTPYLFNVPPRAWSRTLRHLNDLDYEVLVPGHGQVQRDRRYVDLLIETADSIADQRDSLLSDGRTQEEMIEALDFSSVRDRFTGGDPTREDRFAAWAEGPFRYAALKALSGEPMVIIGPRHPDAEPATEAEAEPEPEPEE